MQLTGLSNLKPAYSYVLDKKVAEPVLSVMVRHIVFCLSTMFSRRTSILFCSTGDMAGCAHLGNYSIQITHNKNGL